MPPKPGEDGTKDGDVLDGRRSKGGMRGTGGGMGNWKARRTRVGIY